MGASLYERLGGESALMAAVDLFYDKLLADPLTRPFFDGVDMELQVRKQVAFMSHAMGGPASQRGGDLRAAHAHLVKERGLGDAHFDAVIKHLNDTLRELDVAPADRAEAITVIGRTRDQVLDR